MLFKIFRTYADEAQLEDELEIDIPSSTVDEFSSFYENLLDYLEQPDVSVGAADLESATYFSHFKPKKVEITDEMRDDILEQKTKGLDPFRISFQLYSKYGVEVPTATVQRELREMASIVPETGFQEEVIPF